MKFNLKKELPIVLIVLLPFVYLAYIWSALPEQVPVHWNGNGEIDRWGDKTELVFIPFLLPFLIYVILLAVPLIDPKGKINQMGNKFYHLKFILVLFMSILAIFILYSSQKQSITNMSLLFVLIGFLILALGNYFKTLKPNYFIGIRTPWTLENEMVWKSTHLLAGKLWFIGGFFIIALGLLVTGKLLIMGCLIIIGILVMIPLVHSYLKFKTLEK
jgi:uncharacterized membrane protein